MFSRCGDTRENVLVREHFRAPPRNLYIPPAPYLFRSGNMIVDTNNTRFCECGCGQLTAPGMRFVQHHGARSINNPFKNPSVQLRIQAHKREKNSNLRGLNKEILHELYYSKHLSAIKIGDIYKVGSTTIYRLMDRLHIQRRSMSDAIAGTQIGSKSPKWIPRGLCIHCGARLTGRRMSSCRKVKKYCSTKCRDSYTVAHRLKVRRISTSCEQCGKPLELQPCQIKKHKHNFCSQHCKGLFYIDTSILTLNKINKDPNNRAKVLRGLCARPNIVENKLLTILEKHFPGMWRYTGGGEIILGGLCPDFIHSGGKKLIIELFGDRYHDPAKTFMPEISWKRQEWGRTAIYSQLSYKTLIIWEHELKGMGRAFDIVTKVKRFLE